jgi:hypothetical protein
LACPLVGDWAGAESSSLPHQLESPLLCGLAELQPTGAWGRGRFLGARPTGGGWHSYLQGQGGVVQDDIPLHYHLSLISHLAYRCGPNHVVCLQVLIILGICDLHRMLYFWKEKWEQTE